MSGARNWSALGLICFIGLLTSCGLTAAKGAHKVHCSEDLMRVEIGIPETNGNDSEKPQIYLEGLKGYPDVRCQPEIKGTLAEFRLSLTDFYECGVTRMVNQLTGKKVYYHKIIIESNSGKEIVSVKCITSGPIYNVLINGTSQQQQPNAEQQQTQPRIVLQEDQKNQQQEIQQQHHHHVEHHGIVRRDVLPAGFQEPEDLEITTSLTEKAPEPRLSIGVSQNGKKVAGDLTVTPGTPLTMEINLDRESAPVYGLGVNYLEVTDTRAMSETIIFKGCTVDPYLFENFNTIDGDILSAKFKAFKFPDSSYVQFRATVNVCLDKCLGTKCSNGQIGYGRRRRDTSETLSQTLMDTNKVYEISLAMFIKINDIEGVNRNEVLQLEEKLRELKLNNQRLARNSRGNFVESMKNTEQTSVPAFVVDERELNPIVGVGSSRIVPPSGGAKILSSNLLIILPVISVICKFL